MATIKDIANKLGISVSAVSKGLNGANDISEELRQQVLETAVEMGYSTKRSKKIGHRKLCIFVENLYYDSETQFGYDIVLGFKQNAFRRKWDVTVVPINPQFQKQEEYDVYMLKNGYSGAFLVGFTLEDEWIKQLETSSVPTVLFDNHIQKNPHVCYVGTDNYDGIDLAIDHLYNLGHRKIAFLNGPMNSFVSQQRMDAFHISMRKHNLDVNPNRIASGEYLMETGHYHVPNFLKEGATGIICGNDMIAAGVVAECNRLGYQVPQDISIVGFDDLPVASLCVPPLTTIRQERKEIGKCAFDVLDSLIRQIGINRTLLHPTLIERKSTAQVKK